MSLLRRLVKGTFARASIRRLAHRRFMSRPIAQPCDGADPARPMRVLVLGVYMADRAHTAGHLARALSSTPGIHVTQRWAALFGTSTDTELARVTTLSVQTPAPKFSLINRLLAGLELERFDHVLVVDDDIFVRAGFLVAFLSLQKRLGFALAQPARAWHSHFDHGLVLRRPWLTARQTRFVECGPLVSFSREAVKLLLPFDAENEMWGMDLVWPLALERAGLTMGILDALPVDHSLRGQATTYDRTTEERAMHAFLARTPHLTMGEAFTVVRRHAIWRSCYFWGG
jgi:hypothetical protein